ncbi:MAG: DUF1217 domain-containing protein [Pseudomonadota bacterium]|nr:DUF1217 domain-containing protein [Pseudomonadota bacterium]
MSFQPVIVGSGLVGWNFLQSTSDRQNELFQKSPLILRDTEYFAENIATVQSAEDLVNDRRLLRVALKAFGLQDDINSKALISKVLSEGTESSSSLANKLSDSRYAEFSKAFGFGNPDGAQTLADGFAEDIIARYNAQSFEIAVGDQNETLRLALNAERKLPELAEQSSSNDSLWYQIMGTPPLREVFESALGLPSSFGQIDIDQQLEVFQDKANQRWGTDDVRELATPEMLEEITKTYLLREQAQEIGSSSSGSIALTLLQSISYG